MGVPITFEDCSHTDAPESILLLRRTILIVLVLRRTILFFSDIVHPAYGWTRWQTLAPSFSPKVRTSPHLSASFRYAGAQISRKRAEVNKKHKKIVTICLSRGLSLNEVDLDRPLFDPHPPPRLLTKTFLLEKKKKKRRKTLKTVYERLGCSLFNTRS